MVPLRQPPSPLLPILLFCDVSWALEKWQRSLWGQALSSNSFPELWPAGKCARGNRKAVSGERSHLWAYSTTDPACEDWECLALYVPGDNSGANVVGGGHSHLLIRSEAAPWEWIQVLHFRTGQKPMVKDGTGLWRNLQLTFCQMDT